MHVYTGAYYTHQEHNYYERSAHKLYTMNCILVVYQYCSYCKLRLTIDFRTNVNHSISNIISMTVDVNQFIKNEFEINELYFVYFHWKQN